jgi:hypothetical protein
MIRPGWWLSVFGRWLVLWEECGENLAIFCYRIGVGILSRMRFRALVPVPVFQRTRLAALRSSKTRTSIACSNPSPIFSTPFMTSKD